jgi:hypothetical protein
MIVRKRWSGPGTVIAMSQSTERPAGQRVPYACIVGRSAGHAYCGRAYNAGLDFMFDIGAAEYAADHYDPRVKGNVPPGGLAACIECCDAVRAEQARETA